MSAKRSTKASGADTRTRQATPLTGRRETNGASTSATPRSGTRQSEQSSGSAQVSPACSQADATSSQGQCSCAKTLTEAKSKKTRQAKNLERTRSTEIRFRALSEMSSEPSTIKARQGCEPPILGLPEPQTVKSNTMTRSRFGTTTSFTRSCSGCGRYVSRL